MRSAPGRQTHKGTPGCSLCSCQALAPLILPLLGAKSSIAGRPCVAEEQVARAASPAGTPRTLSRPPDRLLLTLTGHVNAAGETLIPVQLTTAVKGCGRALDPSSDHEDLQEGTAVELPLWLLPRFTCENWARVKCVGLAAVISLWPSCSGRACSARAGPPQKRAVCWVCGCCSSSRAATARTFKCMRPPPKHQLPALCSGCSFFCFFCNSIFPRGFAWLLCRGSSCQACIISASCSHLWAACFAAGAALNLKKA